MKSTYLHECAIVLTATLLTLPNAWAEGSSSASFKGSAPEQASEASTDVTGEARSGPFSSFSLNYTNIFYGPSIKEPSSYQPDSSGNPDKTRPVFTKNYLSAAYNFDPNIAVTGTMYFQWRPVLGQQFTMQDPFARVSHAAIVHTDWGFNLYSDARVHFGVTDLSRQNDLITGLQNFNLASWQIDNSRFTVGIRSSERYNVFGKKGFGNDVELYLAPEAAYQVTPTVAFTLLYEMGADHAYGDKVSYFTNDGTDLEPGVSWDITPSLTVNPYFNIFTGGNISLNSTSIGMFLSWTLL